MPREKRRWFKKPTTLGEVIGTILTTLLILAGLFVAGFFALMIFLLNSDWNTK